ncbi:fimbrillin family protein [uncultured Prevotella sp.]|uniref:fimbrillin family protein n=1 Tax=uncultured Prevotella sp. TaxID=159272 RepID=UPI00258FC84F|nr:fimbrillin family protein [uncultured Prevotella sp.]
MTINKYIILALSILTFAGCSSDDDFSQEQSRLPLTFETSLSGSRSVTRAVGGTFDTGDKLLCYVRHIYSTDLSTDKNYLEVDPYKKLVTIIDGEPTEKLYWDDFSDNNSDGHYLRTANHALQSFYGYCYNGGEPTTALNNTTGVLGWTTDNDQTTDGDMKKNDLLWSPAQNPVTYVHAKENREGLSIPYTHAMSKFTIVVVAGEGFEATDLNAATVTLKDMNLEGTFTAPGSTVVTTGTTEVKMYANATDTEKSSRAYEAVSVPLVSLTKDKLLATINNVDGNNYDIKLTDDILKDWAKGIDNEKSQSGINYKLTITLKKQAITVVATLADWTDVSATGTGEINFTADVKSIDQDNDGLTDGDAFTLWKMSALTKEAFAEAKKTKATYNGSAFTYDNKLYWDKASDDSYFRALAKKETKLTAVEDTTLAQGTDLLWGTTAEHTGTEANGTEHKYEEGVAINPRTGAVPLIFKHVMSKVVVNLETTGDASQVVTTGATVAMTNVIDNGTMNIFTGKVKSGDNKSDVVVKNKDNTITEAIMVPQTIGDNAKLVITLADGTTYSLLLNTCEDKDGKAVTDWYSGNLYEYTITLKKEEIQFRVMVKDWEKNIGSGNATLDWD